MVLVDPSRNHEVLPDRPCKVNVGQVVRKVNDQQDVTGNFMYMLHSLFHYSLAAGVVERKVVVRLSRFLLTVSQRRESIMNPTIVVTGRSVRLCESAHSCVAVATVVAKGVI